MRPTDSELSLLTKRIRDAKLGIPAFEYPYSALYKRQVTAIIFNKKSYGEKLALVLRKHGYDFSEIMPNYTNTYFKYKLIIN